MSSTASSGIPIGVGSLPPRCFTPSSTASGFPLSIVQGSNVWGGSLLLGTNSGAIGLGGANFGTDVHSGVAGSNGTGTAGNPATKGTGLNIFADPNAVLKAVRRIHLSEDTRSGRNALRGLGFWQTDMTLGKSTTITERVKLRLSIDMVNVFNHVNFNDPTISLQSPSSFGVISTQRISDLQNIFPRRVQLSGSIEF